MTLPIRIAALLSMLACLPLVQAAGAIHKCVINGTVTYQSSPCPSDTPSRHPTKEELNAERKKRLAAAAAQPAPALPPAGGTQRPAETGRSPAAVQDPGFRCDGRQHCSQMRSCSEARFFLANCPGTKMDGNRDGVPCEQQWCTHPLAR